MSTIYSCPDEDDIVHKKKEELIDLISKRKIINRRIKEIKLFIN